MRRRLERDSVIFIDTSAYGAIIMTDDAKHHEAAAIFRRLTAQRQRLYTTNFVVAELQALVLARSGRLRALAALDWIERGIQAVIRVDEEGERRARAILTQYRDKDFTLVDAMSFSVMERLDISIAFTFDHHFSQFGFQLAS